MADMCYNEGMPASLKYTVRGLPATTREQIKILGVIRNEDAATVIACAVYDYYTTNVISKEFPQLHELVTRD